MRLKGKIVSGLKKAAFFVQLDWVQEQCISKLGFSPYPGTLNLEMSTEDIPVVQEIYKNEGMVLKSPDPKFCSGKVLPVNVEGVPGAVMIPGEEARVHGYNIVELIAPQKLKDMLGVTEGDFISFNIHFSPSKEIKDKLNVDAVIFDLDGTLIDSTEIHFKVLAMAFDRIGIPQPSRRNILEAVKDGHFDWQCVLPPDWKNRVDEVVEKTRLMRDDFYLPILEEELELIQGADNMLKEISQHGMRIGLVTTTPRQDLYHKMRPLREASVDHLFEVIITTDDVQEIKPSPEPLFACMEGLGIDLHRSVYIGDARIDIIAGKKAGMKTIAVLTGFDDQETLNREEPDAIISSVNELREAIDY